MECEFNRAENNILNHSIKRILIEIGFTTKHTGFEYLCEAIKVAIKCPGIKSKVYDGIYSAVADKFDSTKSRVERNIRHAIENTFINKNFLKINEMFGMNIYTINDKPTNGELISLLAEYYNMEVYTPAQ